MLKISAVLVDGSVVELKKLLTVVLNCDVDVPADDLSVTVPFDRILGNTKRLVVKNEEELVFEGIADETINLVRDNQAITKITARSLAGVLLDNEAEPVTYVNPDAEFIFNRHLKPFGFESFYADKEPFYGYLRIEKGMTHWQVINNFCRNRYGAQPYISGNKRAYFTGYLTDDTVTFGSDDGVEYFSIKESRKPCKIISEVRIKVGEYSGYKSRVVNKYADTVGIQRVRYLNANADNTTVRTADKMIELGNIAGYGVMLECAGCHLDIMGRKAIVKDKLLGCIEGLRIASIKYILSENSETTSVVLRKENSLCG